MLSCNKIVQGMGKKVKYLDHKSNKIYCRLLNINLTSTLRSFCLRRLLSRTGAVTNGIEFSVRRSANLGAKFINTN